MLSLFGLDNEKLERQLWKFLEKKYLKSFFLIYFWICVKINPTNAINVNPIVIPITNKTSPLSIQTALFLNQSGTFVAIVKGKFMF